jgi:hypothetical protein
MNLKQIALTLFAAGTTALAATSSFAADSVKIAVIDPLSGPFANVGEAMVRYTQLAADAINARGGVLGGTKIEIIALDSKSSPQEAQPHSSQPSTRAFASSTRATVQTLRSAGRRRQQAQRTQSHRWSCTQHRRRSGAHQRQVQLFGIFSLTPTPT